METTMVPNLVDLHHIKTETTKVPNLFELHHMWKDRKATLYRRKKGINNHDMMLFTNLQIEPVQRKTTSTPFILSQLNVGMNQINYTSNYCVESALKFLGDLTHTYFVGNAPMAHMVIQATEEMLVHMRRRKTSAESKKTQSLLMGFVSYIPGTSSRFH
ncbi:hypothetical protein YC2023_048214 [Brassica napus]